MKNLVQWIQMILSSCVNCELNQSVAITLKIPIISDNPSILTTTLSVDQSSPGVYYKKYHNLVIKICNLPSEYICIDIHKPKIVIMSSLTPKKIVIVGNWI
jgi:hypothetical protein